MENSPTTPATLTVAEYAQLARASKDAVYDAVRRGDIPSVRVGRLIRIPRSALGLD